MITWMQKHKKWLIVTIWISTIAFVGAGFVGWGSYDYGKSGSTIAIVGDKEIPSKDVQAEYSNLYSQYQQILGDNFNQELAKQFKLEDIALQRVVQKYLILNYADDIGIVATDKDVASELVKITAFIKDGKFDKNTYLSVLKQNRRTAVEFETQLKQDIVVNKVQELFKTQLVQNEIKNIGSLIYSEDEVSLQIIDGNDIKISTTTENLQKYWAENKDNYKSASGFEIAYNKIDNIENKTKKDMKKIALKTYLDLKKDKEQFTTTKTIYSTSTLFDAEDVKTIISSKEGTVLKPIYKDNNYYVVKLNKKVLPTTLAYNEVAAQVKSDYVNDEKAKLLDEKAKKAEANFQGTNLGYIGRSNIPSVEGLSDSQRDEFIKDMFSATKTINTLNLGSKILVYKITNSRFAKYDSTKDAVVDSTVGNLKASSLSSSFLTKLATEYEVKSFMGNK
ncbi:MAG: SurA N-terminal domain-containing protein [Arcobacteraceae bacterium]